MEDETAPLRKRKSGSVTTGIIISWATFWFFLLMPFGFVAWISILFKLIDRQINVRRYLLFSAWIFVPGCNFVLGAASYFQGDASLMGIGGPTTYHGIDLDTRVPTQTSGCIVVGAELFINIGNNAAVRLCTSLFGYQKGAYTGRIPTPAEVKDLIAVADTVPMHLNGDFYELNLNSNTLQIHKDSYNNFIYTSPDSATVKIVDENSFLFSTVENRYNEYVPIYLVSINQKEILTTFTKYDWEYDKR